MVGKFLGRQRWFAGFVAAFLLLGIPSFASASPDELQRTKDHIRSKNRHWLASETEISRLPMESRKMRLGLFAPEAAATGTAASAAPGPGITGVAPATLDWRNYNGYSYVTPVRDQMNCGSCWAFATTAALEANLMIATGGVSDLAEQIMVSCSGAGSCNGGYIDRASNFILGTGLPSELAYPYTAQNGACANALAGWKNATSGITSWHYVAGTSRPTLSQIKDELATYGPLVTTMSVYSDFYYYAGGVYQYTSGTYQGGHAILLVGYDDAQQYFIVKNSWGGSWGESGYFKIGYSELASVVGFGSYSIAYFTNKVVPGITVVAPNGAESWSAGTAQTIRWSYTGSPGSTVALDLYNNDVLAGSISASTPIGTGGSGSFTWNIPETLAPGSLYRVAVTSTSNGTYTDASDNYFSITPPVAPAITVAAPNGGESWTRGTAQTIRWSYVGSPGSTVAIDLYSNGVLAGPITASAPIGTGGSGSFTWNIPTTLAAGNLYRVAVTSTSNSACTDTSDNNFSIAAPTGPTITVTAPNGGESWARGSAQTIRWSVTGAPGTYVKIELLKAGSSVLVISPRTTTSTGSYLWRIPTRQTVGSDYTIRVTSYSNSAYKDVSNSTFSIK